MLAGLVTLMIRSFMPDSRQPSKCWLRFANGLERTRNRVSRWSSQIYILGVIRERARELVRSHRPRPPLLESLRELYEKDRAAPSASHHGIINVTGLTCVGVPIGIPELVNAVVRSKAHAIEQDVQTLHIVRDPKIHYDLLRLSTHAIVLVN